MAFGLGGKEELLVLELEEEIYGKVYIILHRECYSLAGKCRVLRDVMRVEMRKKFV